MQCLFSNGLIVAKHASNIVYRISYYSLCISYFTECTKVNVRNGQNIGKFDRRKGEEENRKKQNEKNKLVARE